MGQEVIKPEEMKLSDRLAVERTIMGADRTLMASVRTSLSLISFGFTIYKVLDAMQKAGVAKMVRAETPRNIGLFMILVGIVPLALSMFQYERGLKRLGDKRNVYLNPNMISAGAIFLLGIVLLIVVVLNLNVI